MTLSIAARVERWPVAGAFIIARGAKTHVDVVQCEVTHAGRTGRGEGTPIYYEGETAESCAAAIRAVAPSLCAMRPREARQALQQLIGRGAARNALDCALWDCEAQVAGVPLWQLLGPQEPSALTTAFTVSLNDPDRMGADARSAAERGYNLLKCKLTGAGDTARIAAVRDGAPQARLIVDANESWAPERVEAEACALAALGVEMIEQPLPHDRDALLTDVTSPLPLVADESCHTAADVPACVGRYAGINIKLDKAGGLTEALRLAEAAQAAGLELMVGCMLSTSLGIAPAFLLAQRARWVDLDGPALLARDRPGGFRFRAGTIALPLD